MKRKAFDICIPHFWCARGLMIAPPALRGLSGWLHCRHCRWGVRKVHSRFWLCTGRGLYVSTGSKKLTRYSKSERLNFQSGCRCFNYVVMADRHENKLIFFLIVGFSCWIIQILETASEQEQYIELWGVGEGKNEEAKLHCLLSPVLGRARQLKS